MKTKLLLFATLLTCFSSLAVAQTTTQPTPAASQSSDDIKVEYKRLVESVKGGDMNVDFIHFRDVYGKLLCDDKAALQSPNREAFVAAFEAKDYSKAAELIEEVLEYEFVHLGLHHAAEDTYRALKNQAKADFHKAIGDKLVNALLTSGDGKSATTAYRVLTIKEEYFIMNQLGYKVNMQALLTDNDKAYDVLSGRDTKTNKDVSVYFDISSFFGGCKRTKN